MSETKQTGPEPRKWKVVARKFASLIGWVWGSFSILTGLMFLAVGPGAAQRMTGLSALCAGLLLLPPIVNLIRQRIAFMRTPGLPTVAAVIVGVAILIVAPWPKPDIARSVPAAGAVAVAKSERRPSRAERQRAEREQEEAENQSRLQAEVNTMWSELTRLTQPCDQAAAAVSENLDMSRSNLIRAYSAAEAAKRICSSAGLNVMLLAAPPSLEGDEQRAFDQSLDKCGLAYTGKSVMFDRMLRVIDGDRRPSQLARVQEASRISQAETMQCVVDISALADEQGIELGGETSRPTPP